MRFLFYSAVTSVSIFLLTKKPVPFSEASRLQVFMTFLLFGFAIFCGIKAVKYLLCAITDLTEKKGNKKS